MRLDHITPKLGVRFVTTASAKRILSNSCIRPFSLNLSQRVRRQHQETGLLDDHRTVEPPESISNSEVKRGIADGSVGLPHVRVGHRQVLNQNTR